MVFVPCLLLRSASEAFLGALRLLAIADPPPRGLYQIIFR